MRFLMIIKKLVIYNDNDPNSFAPKIYDDISLQRLSVSGVKNWLEGLSSSKGLSKEVQLCRVNSEEPISFFEDGSNFIAVDNEVSYDYNKLGVETDSCIFTSVNLG